MRIGTAVAIAFFMSQGAVMAQGIEASPRPLPRPSLATGAQPTSHTTTVSTANAVEAATSPRPRARPLLAAAEPAPAINPDSVVELAATVAPTSILPRARPASLAEQPMPGKRKGQGWGIFKAAAVRTQPGNESILPKKGSVCGDPSIRGEAIPPITSRVKGCGVPDAVKVTSVAGVKLSDPATIDCTTAVALKNWVEAGLKPAFGKNEVVQIQLAGHYSCRPRNNIRGNKISEHGRGKAVDISGIVLADGTTLSVLRDWRRKGFGKAIKAAHKSACGIFGTTLGPGSDGHHEDHLHFDTAKRNSGAYCR